MKLAHFLPLALLLISHSAYSERRIALMGGGGEPVGNKTTIFDETLNSFDRYLQKNKWGQVVLIFNGDHSTTDDIIKTKFRNAALKANISQNNFNAVIKQYENQIKTGELKSGDQLLVMIESHGLSKSADELTHSVAVRSENPTVAESLNNSSMDAFKNLTELAKEKGIKLAIIDFSSYSGNSLELANENNCVISSTGKDHPGFTTFAEKFISNMAAGKSLEDVFLETRKNTADNSYPMISSPEGQIINRDIYPGLTPYLYHQDHQNHPKTAKTEDKLSEYLIKSSSDKLCKRENQFAELEKQLAKLRETPALNISSHYPDIDGIKLLIQYYKRKQDNYIKLLNSWGVTELSRKEQFSATATSGKKSFTMSGNFTWKELVETDFDGIIKNVSYALPMTKDPATQAQFKASIQMHTLAFAKQKEILSQYPKLKDYKENFQIQLSELEGTYAIANQIAMEERKLYSAMYSNLRKDKAPKNACNDFIL